eukprot:RCo055205
MVCSPPDHVSVFTVLVSSAKKLCARAPRTPVLPYTAIRGMTNAMEWSEAEPPQRTPSAEFSSRFPDVATGHAHGPTLKRHPHGFVLPLDPMQIAAWGLIFVLPIFYGVFCAPILPMPAIVLCNLFYSISWVSAVITNIGAARTDPTDPLSLVPLPEEIFNGPVPDGKSACAYCQAFVDESSKHCRKCDRCTRGFDHHCKWLNTCIGEYNLRWFYAFVFSSMAACTTHTATAIYQFALSFVDPFIATRLSSVYPNLALNAWRVLTIIPGVVSLAVAAPLTFLLSFHIWMAMTSQTTYKWLVARRRRKRERQKQREAAESSEV